jgi:hypothetical protein
MSLDNFLNPNPIPNPIPNLNTNPSLNHNKDSISYPSPDNDAYLYWATLIGQE